MSTGAEADDALDKARKHKKRQLEDTLNLVIKKRKKVHGSLLHLCMVLLFLIVTTFALPPKLMFLVVTDNMQLIQQTH